MSYFSDGAGTSGPGDPSSWALAEFQSRVLPKFTAIMQSVAGHGLHLTLDVDGRTIATFGKPGTFPKAIERSETVPGLGQVRLRGTSSESAAETVDLLGLALLEVTQLTLGDQVARENTMHEIGVSLSAIQGAAEFLLDAGDDAFSPNASLPRPIAANVRVAGEQAEIGLWHLENLMRYYSARRGEKRSRPRTSTLDLSEILTSVVRTWRAMADSKGIELRSHITEPILIRADPQMIKQALSNVVSNAIKYSYFSTATSKTRHVDVRAKLFDPGFRQRRVEISVQNYGIAIDKDEISRIGSFGFRGSAAQNSGRPGFGIGMYVVNEIMSLHDGEVRIQSRPATDSTRDGDDEDVPHLTKCSLLFPVLEAEAHMSAEWSGK